MKTPTGGRFAPPLAGSPAFVSAFVFVSISVEFELRNDTTKNWLTDAGHDRKTGCEKKRSASQTIDLVMTIQTVQESSKSELSSRCFGRLKFSTRTLLGYHFSCTVSRWGDVELELPTITGSRGFYSPRFLYRSTPENFLEISNGRKIVRIAPILTILGPFESS